MQKSARIKFLGRTGLVLGLTAFMASGLTPDYTALAAGGGSGGGGAGGLSAPQTPKKDPAPYYRQGLLDLKAGDYRAAEKNFKEVLSVVPRDAKSNYFMGMAKIAGEDVKGAERYLKKAVKYDQTFYDARKELGLVYLQLDKTDKAEKELQALEKAVKNCGDCRPTERSQAEAAHAALKAAIEGGSMTEDQVGSLLFEEGDADLTYRSAVSLINEEKFGAAILELKRSAAIYGPHPDILNYLGFTHRKVGQYDVAIGYYRQALAIAPNHRGATEYLGELYVQLGQLDQARAQLAKLSDICTFGCAEEEDLRVLIDTAP